MAIRGRPPIAGRLEGPEWPAHHLLPRAWLKRLLIRADLPLDNLDALNRRSPAILMEFDEHVVKDADGIHSFLDPLLDEIDDESVSLEDIRDNLLSAYDDFDDSISDDIVSAVDRFMRREGLCGTAWTCEGAQ